MIYMKNVIFLENSYILLKMLELYISPNWGYNNSNLSGSAQKKRIFTSLIFTNRTANGKTQFSYCFNMISDRSVLKRLFTIRSEYL